MKKSWTKWEEEIAEMLGGKRNKASGSLWYAPSDVKSNSYLAECKETNKLSFSLTKKILEKTSDEALFSHRIPMWAIKIQDKKLIVMEKEDFKHLL